MDHFELFGIAKDLQIDKAALKKKYYQLSKKYHPDHAENLTEEQQELHFCLSIQTNKAYQILSNQTSRIEYILELAGHQIGESGNKLPPAFLMEMMDINEALMDAKMEGNEAALSSAKSQILQFQEELNTQIEELNASFIFSKAGDFEFNALKDYILKGRYLKRLLTQLD